MGNNLGCCYSTRQYDQCLFPCIRTCSYSHRRVFYNYDGMERVQPLVHFYFPKKKEIHSLPRELKSCGQDTEVAELLKKGLTAQQQLCTICLYASKNGYTVHAVGTGASWSRMTSTRDILVNMTTLDRFLTPQPTNREDNLNKEYVDIEVEGGMRVVDFVEDLDKYYGLGLPMIGNYAGQTVAGVASTSTHGSGYFSGSMSTSVVGIHLVTYRGIQVRISLGNETFDDCKQKLDGADPCGVPVELHSTYMLRAAVVGLGSLGIVYSITYRCIPVYNLEENRSIIKVPWKDKTTFRIKDRLAAAFTNKDEGEFFSFFINPYPQPRGFLYASVLQSKRTTRRPGCCKCCICWCGAGGRGCSDCGLLQTDCTGSCLQSCANCCLARVPDFMNYGLSQYSLKRPFVHKWYNVLQLSKGNMHVRTAEWCLPLDKLDAALGDVIETAIQYATRHTQYSLLPVYVRIARTDELLMSPANNNFATGETEHCCYIEVPFMAGAFGIDEFQAVIEELLFTKYKARPHWGKNNQLNTTRVSQLYPQLEEFKKVFILFNKDGTFCNEFTKRMGFDNFMEDLTRDSEHNNVVTVEPID